MLLKDYSVNAVSLFCNYHYSSRFFTATSYYGKFYPGRLIIFPSEIWYKTYGDVALPLIGNIIGYLTA